MNKTKFYYSAPMQIRRVPVITDDNGEVLFVYDKVEAICKKLPRVTVASCYDPDTNTMRFGVAVCSTKDQFSKKVGRELAESRALKSPEMTICAIHRKKISKTSKKYASELIKKHMEKYVQFDL